MEKKYYIMNASITVEAAYIVPVVLMLTITLIYAVMIVHDRGIIYMELQKYSEKKCFNEVVIPEKDIIDVTEINSSLFAYKINSAIGKKEGSKLHVKAYVESFIKPVMLFAGAAGLMNYSVDIRQKMNDRCKEVRKAVVLVE